MATRRIVIPEVDGKGQFYFDPKQKPLIVCIGCGCDEEHACPSSGGLQVEPTPERCSWVAVDEEAGVGICSVCAAKPIEELLQSQILN